jgi:hypothetical protein
MIPAKAPCRSSPVKSLSDELSLVLRCASEQMAQDLLASGPRSAPRHRLDLVDRRVEISHRQRWPASRPLIEPEDGGRADPDTALTRQP